jgi:hypothetical protein
MQNRSRVVGLTQFKNKPSRNAFDKTHRHMFTTNFGQILPIFCEWLNPGETIKLGYAYFFCFSCALALDKLLVYLL